MKLARKFKGLVENEPTDQPDYAWLAHAVCACGGNCCGWSGWIIEAAFMKTAERHATGTGDKLVDADYSQKCPVCGSVLFRTGFTRRLELSRDQEPRLRPGIDYAVADNIEYE